MSKLDLSRIDAAILQDVSREFTFSLDTPEPLALLQQPVSVLCGEPHERKKYLIVAHRIAERAGASVLMLAATGKAARNLPFAGATVHAALGWDPVEKTFEKGLFDQIEADVVMVDYADLLEEEVLERLSAATRGAVLILTRDAGMLGTTINPSRYDISITRTIGDGR